MEDMPTQLATAGRSGSAGVRKGAWTPEEDLLLKKCIEKYGDRQWHLIPTRAGLRRCRKSCRLRWLNYLKPNIKRGPFDKGEVDLIVRLHRLVGNRWTLIASRIPGRTANDVKNFWNSHLGKLVRPNPQGVVDNEETAGSTTVVEPNPAGASTENSYPTGTPSGAPSFVVKPQALIPPETASLWAPMNETSHETSYEPSATDGEAANEEDLLSWVRNLLLGDEGEDEEEQRQQQQQKWEQENMVPFPTSSQAGGSELLDTRPWSEEIPKGWGQGGLEDMSLGSHPQDVDEAGAN